MHELVAKWTMTGVVLHAGATNILVHWYQWGHPGSKTVLWNSALLVPLTK